VSRLLWVLVCVVSGGIPAATAARPPAGLGVGKAVLASAVDDKVCVAPKPADQVTASDRQVFLWVSLRNVRAGDQIRIEWVDPSGQVAIAAPYTDLPAASELCIISQLPIAGFGPARQPGAWIARVVGGERVLAFREFKIGAGSDSRAPHIDSVTRAERDGGKQVEYTLWGSGFREGATMHVALYSRTGGWRYVAAIRPESLEAGRMMGRAAALPPSDYVMLVRNPDGSVSSPEPFIVATGRAYKLPTGAGENWVITQGPYGTFSHWGNSLHAYDIAPRTGRCVVAMRAGVVTAHDRGMYQNIRTRTFGNYISVDHGDGEYSHYGHLATGTFLVRTGERVEQGQALATAGNSGYTLGEGGGTHVHVHVTRAPSASASSVPFRFEDMPEWRAGRYVPVVSRNGVPNACAQGPSNGPTMVATAAGGAARTTAVKTEAPAQQAKLPGTVIAGTVEATRWWTQFVFVPAKATALETMLRWKDEASALDLHLVSPAGHHYGWYGDTQGYSGRSGNPQSFRLNRPAEGWWRISVQASRGSHAPIEFEVLTSAQKAGPGGAMPAVGGGDTR
jgi:murein DD-endopeptidase MepM/ murein hydrolase activator NlpD